MDTSPPVAATPRPPLIDTGPPSLPPSPACNVNVPPLPVSPAPTTTDTAPPAPPSPLPDCMSTMPDDPADASPDWTVTAPVEAASAVSTRTEVTAVSSSVLAALKSMRPVVVVPTMSVAADRVIAFAVASMLTPASPVRSSTLDPVVYTTPDGSLHGVQTGEVAPRATKRHTRWQERTASTH